MKGGSSTTARLLEFQNSRYISHMLSIGHHQQHIDHLASSLLPRGCHATLIVTITQTKTICHGREVVTTTVITPHLRNTGTTTTATTDADLPTTTSTHTLDYLSSPWYIHSVSKPKARGILSKSLHAKWQPSSSDRIHRSAWRQR